MIGPVHPEVGRAIQRLRHDEIDHVLRGCRRPVRRDRKEER